MLIGLLFVASLLSTILLTHPLNLIVQVDINLETNSSCLKEPLVSLKEPLVFLKEPLVFLGGL